eukprot:329639-Pyramimonas_sp.AAC.2
MQHYGAKVMYRGAGSIIFVLFMLRASSMTLERCRARRRLHYYPVENATMMAPDGEVYLPLPSDAAPADGLDDAYTYP